jgi:hypothetical protein
MAEQTAATQATTEAAAVDPKAAAGTAVAAAAVEKVEATETIKVNGKEVKVTPAQLRALAQKGYFADQRVKSADVVTQKTTALINALKTPDGFLEVLQDKSLGVNPKEVFKKLLSAGFVDDEVRDMMGEYLYNNDPRINKGLTPEQLEQRKKLDDYERLKKQEDQRKQEDLTKQQQAQVQQVYQAVRAEVAKQVVADKTFPQTEGTIRQVVEKLRVMNRQGLPVTTENVTKALGLVKKDFLAHQTAILDAITDDEALVAAIGEARALRISRALVKRLQAKGKTVAAEGAEKLPKNQDTISKKFGKERHGYTVMDV